MQSSYNIPLKNVTLVGGGHSHVHVIKMFGMKPITGVRVTVISRDIESPYSGMIPGYIAGYYTKEECHIDLGKLASFSGVRFIHAEVNKIDFKKKLIYCSDGRPPLCYDILSINTGIIPKPIKTNIDPNKSTITAVKPIDKFASKWEHILECLTTANPFTETSTIAIVGGGAGGIELSFAMKYRFKKFLEKAGKSQDFIKILLINKSDSILTSHCKRVQDIVLRLLNEKGIKLINSTEIESVNYEQPITGIFSKCKLISKTGAEIECNEVFWCTQATAPNWIKESGIDCDEDGFIRVQPTLESTNSPNVFAAGDVCHNVKYPRPKAGVFAVRAGPILNANIRKMLFNEPLEEWEPQTEFLGLIGTGDDYAVASKGPLALEGEYLWKLKDKIDVTWMAGYKDLPDKEEMMKNMQEARKDEPINVIPPLFDFVGEEALDLIKKSKMRCGGCGSKVGSQILSRVIKNLRPYMSHTRRHDIISGIHMKSGDDAALVMPPPLPNYLVQTIDYFKSFISDPYLFGQIAANHALSDIFAMNADPVSALALCVLPYGKESMVEETLAHMLAGAISVFNSEDCMLVGGHTSEGSDESLGFSVTGVVHPDKVLPKGPLQKDNVLILTKALGTGTILAADMRAKAKGSWVLSAIQRMKLSNRKAAKLIKEYGGVACTDITGFGLVGHLLEMIKFEDDITNGLDQDLEDNASNPNSIFAVELDIDSLPALIGVEECISQRIFSSLHEQNIRCARAIDNIEMFADNAKYPLLFDPQTSGGLLASVPKDIAKDLVSKLIDAGYEDTTIIGKVTARESGEFTPLIKLVSKHMNH